MNISNQSSSPTFNSAGFDLDPQGQLALLMLEQEQTQSDAAKQDKAVARQNYMAAADKVVAEMHQEADHILLGAVVQGSCALAASGIQLGDAIKDPIDPKTGLIDPSKEKPWGEIGAGMCNATAQLMDKLLGQEPAANDRASAEQGRTHEKLAEWQLDDANKAIDHAQKSQDKAFEFVTTVNANNASAETAIIAGFA